MPEPVFQDSPVFGLAAGAAEDDGGVDQCAQAVGGQGEGCGEDGGPGGGHDGGDGEGAAEMDDGGGSEGVDGLRRGAAGRLLAMRVMTTNWRPMRAPPEEPMMT